MDTVLDSSKSSKKTLIPFTLSLQQDIGLRIQDSVCESFPLQTLRNEWMLAQLTKAVDSGGLCPPSFSRQKLGIVICWYQD